MVREEKIKATEKMKELIGKYPVICILDMHKLPSKQFQEIKKKFNCEYCSIEKLIVWFGVKLFDGWIWNVLVKLSIVNVSVYVSGFVCVNVIKDGVDKLPKLSFTTTT